MAAILRLRDYNFVPPLEQAAGVSVWTAFVVGATRGWHRVMPLPPPRIATQNPPDSHPTAATETVCLHSLQKVFGAGRRKSATRTRPANEVDSGGDDLLIAANQDADEPFHSLGAVDVAGLCVFFKRPARFASRSQSCSSSCKVASGERQRAMVTK